MTLSSFGPSPLKHFDLPQYIQVQHSIIKPYPNFWHGKVRCKIDPEI